MKLRCSAGHEYDTEAVTALGNPSEGERCPMELSYDRMHGSKYCRRVLREDKPHVQIIAHKRCGEWTWTLARVGFKGHESSKPLESSRSFLTKRAALADAKVIATNAGLNYSPNA